MAYLVDSVVDFINANLTAELGASPSVPKAFADAAPVGVATRMPYVIVHDPDEHYQRASDGTAYGYLIGDGHLYCVVKSAGKGQAHSIGLALLRKLTIAADDGVLAIDDGTLDELVPLSGSSTPLTEVATTGTPTTLTERTIGFHFKITYPSIS